MSTSVIKNDREQALKRARKYMLITLICIAFGWIYEIYSFGVYSNYMIYAFVFPLIGGVVFWLLIGTTKKKIRINRIFINCQSAAIATLTLGFAFKGVLDIYGTTSNLNNVYWIVGVLFAFIAVASLIKDNFAYKT